MPIYAYRCGDCGFEKDVLQKFADAPLSDCPQCHKPAFARMVTAPTFQLKGTGWYVTDFRGGKGAQAGAPAGAPAGEGGAGNGKADGSGSGGDTSAPAGGAPATSQSGASAGADGSKAS